jgi:MFS family permease
MSLTNPLGYTAVLRNRNFLALWLAQVFSNTALNAFFFLSIILIEDITGSSTQLAGAIIAFTFPSVLFSAMAGVVVDRISKKIILIASNALRVVTAAALAILAYNMLTHRISDWLSLAWIYALVFLSSAIGQFFAPAEGSTIPLLVEPENLLSANSLFQLTLIASQVVAVIILAPLGTKVIGITASLWTIAAMYIIATILVTLIPRDRPNRVARIDGVSLAAHAWQEIREGWHFALTRRAILIALLQLTIGSAMTMTMTMLAPGYAARVLGLQAEDAIVVFWPVGVGMLLASFLIGRFASRVPREILASVGIVGMGLALTGMAFAGRTSAALQAPIFRVHPEWLITTTAIVMFFSFWVGVAMTLINIPAQTIVQEHSTDAVRGRVFAVQFTMSSAMGIPPMLFAGALADLWGIPRVTLAIAAVLILIGAPNATHAILAARRARAHVPIPSPAEIGSDP